jgi:NADH-quinone oxidoreductase subunit J
MESLHLFICFLISITGLFVFLSDNPVHSVLYLILTFCLASASLFLFNAEFLALIFIIVYVGAIAVLFLFVVMMLNIKLYSSNSSIYLPLIFLVSITLILIFALTLKESFSSWIFWSNSLPFDFNGIFDNLSNIDVLGQVLYNYFLLCFLLAGIILLIAMLGAINLTLNFSSKRKSELINRQLSRSDNFLAFFK